MSKIQLPSLELLEENPNTNDLFLIRRSGGNSDNKIRYSKLIRNIIPQLDYHTDPINSYDVLPMRLVNPNGGYLESNDRKVTFSNLSKHVNNTIKTSNVFDVVSFTDSSVSVLIALKTSYGLPLTELKKNMEICFISDQDRLTDKKFKIRVDNISIDSGQLLYNDSSVVKDLQKGLEIRAIFNGIDFIMSSGYYPGLTPYFQLTNNYNNNYLLNFKNTYSEQLGIVTYTFTINKDNDSSTDYSSLANAVRDIERKFSQNKENIKIKLIVDNIEINYPLIIDRDLSYIELMAKNDKISVDCIAQQSIFLIIGNGRFFSVASNTIFELSISKTNSSCNFIQLHNNLPNNFENFTIRVAAKEKFGTNSYIHAIFNIVFAAGGVTMLNTNIESLTTNLTESKYRHGIIAGLYSSSILLNNIKVKNRENGGYGILIAGIVISSGNTYYAPYKHNILVINSDLSPVSSSTTSDIYFDTRSKGYAVVNKIDSVAGSNKTPNTSDATWGWYTSN